MANTRQIKRRIGAASNISKITKAMEMVAASKMKRAQDQAVLARHYAIALHSSLNKLASQTDPSSHPLLSSHDEGVDILLVIGTNKGLCGSLNTQLLKETSAWFKAHPQGEVIAVGKRVVHFCKLMGYKIHAQFTDLPEKIQVSDLIAITSLVTEKFLDHSYKSVGVLYTDFINTLSQRAKLTTLLPLSADSEMVAGQGIEGESLLGKVPLQTQADQKKENKLEYTFEPSAQKILGEILPFYIENTIYQAFLESMASEHSARMVTMKNASENAHELVSELKIVFNKSRQAGITSELLDITTASLTLD